MAGRHFRDRLGRARGHDLTAAITAFRADINNPVRGFHDIKVMFDHDHRIPGIDKFMKHLQELLNVLEMQARGRLIKDIERTAS